jgi:hypothetical protein
MFNRLNIPVLGTVINGARRHSAGSGDYLYLLSETGQAAPATAANP